MEEKPPAYDQPGYPPQQPGYPQPGYPPQQPGYPPQQQPGYPPQQPGYPPAQPGYPPQQPGYPPGAPQPTTVVVQQPVVVTTTTFGENSQNIICSNCRANVMTSQEYTGGTCMWVAVGVLCLFCCPCSWVPCVMDGCKDVIHRCPSCQAEVGVY